MKRATAAAATAVSAHGAHERPSHSIFLKKPLFTRQTRERLQLVKGAIETP
jgi:hypothetical protein